VAAGYPLCKPFVTIIITVRLRSTVLDDFNRSSVKSKVAPANYGCKLVAAAILEP